MIEYLIVKKCILRLCHQFDTSVCQYINTDTINQNNWFLYKNKFYSINDLKSKFYYSILVENKSKQSSNEQYWQCLFQLELLHKDWSDTYTPKIWNMPIKKIAEFNYKLFHKIITCRYLISKWTNEITPYCIYCHDIEIVEHMIFNYPERQYIWKRIDTIMNINIKWRHVAIGYTYINRNTLLRNTPFTFIAFCIYKTKILNSLNNPNH